ncbi:hypothetical protein LNN75_09120 [Klebsiella pneumoniae subsp. pneumoniae]|nr:hypothetical protein [Klebsiella pneumoniae subsp. pneumoniae]
MEIESCRFVLEPSYKKDGSVHSWEILTKNVIKKNANGYLANESAFCFSTLSDKEKIDLFNKQILTIEEIDAYKLKLKPVSLNVDSLISDYILNDKYISDYLKKQKTLPLRLTKSFMNLILNAV